MQKTKQLLEISISEDLESADVKFIETIFVPAQTDHPEDESAEYSIPYKCRVPFRPHKDLIDSLKKLRKPALDCLGIDLADESKSIKNWVVTGISLKGDHNLHQARVNIILGTKNKYTGKMSEIETGQITMYPESEEKAKYPHAEKIAPIVEDIIEEVWSYMAGKHESGLNPQLALFANEIVVQ